MFKILTLAALLAFTNANKIDQDAETLSLKYEAPNAEGNYAYAFDTSNGIQQQEAGNPNGVAGAFEYITPESQKISVSYTADENGFQPMGDHLPTPPPIPDSIIRALEYIASHRPPPQQQ